MFFRKKVIQYNVSPYLWERQNSSKYFDKLKNKKVTAVSSDVLLKTAPIFGTPKQFEIC